MISQEERHLFAPQTSHRDLSHRSLVTLQTNFLVQILNARMATFGDVDGGVFPFAFGDLFQSFQQRM